MHLHLHLILTLLLALAAPVAGAQMFTDPALEALYRARRPAELDAAAQVRLASRADDAQAVLALTVALQPGWSTAARRKAAVARAEACVELQPRAAECQYALGVALAAHGMSEGMLTLAGSIGRVRAALHEAAQLAPRWYAARSALVGFHVMAPGLMGGSRDKAAELARSAPTPGQVQALQALLLLADEKPEAALGALMAVKPGSDSALDEDVRDWSHQAGFALLNLGQPARARPWFERAAGERPQEARAAYGLGRTQAELGAHADALAWYERARGLDGAAELPIDYRAGISQQALGQAAAARASFARFVQAARGQRKALDDARRRLEQLGPA